MYVKAELEQMGYRRVHNAGGYTEIKELVTGPNAIGRSRVLIKGRLTLRAVLTSPITFYGSIIVIGRLFSFSMFIFAI